MKQFTKENLIDWVYQQEQIQVEITEEEWNKFNTCLELYWYHCFSTYFLSFRKIDFGNNYVQIRFVLKKEDVNSTWKEHCKHFYLKKDETIN